MLPYMVDFQKLREKIMDKGYNKVLLQLPDGLITYARDIVKELSDFNVFLSSEPCYGACDIVVHEDKLTVQFGHSEIPNIRYPENVIFVEMFSDKKFDDVVEKFIEKTRCDSVGIVASVQHVNHVSEVKALFEKRGITALIGQGDSRVKYPGQVLGCNFSAARAVDMDVDCFVLLGTGVFHGVGVRITTGKKTYVLDPFSNTVTDVEAEADRIVRQRFGAIALTEQAERFGIIISDKIGQKRERLALTLKSMIESAGFEAYLIYANRVVPENFYYDVDAYVNTACPRITYDDYLRFRKPILSPVELQIALKYKLWENYSFDEIVYVD